MVVSIHYCRIIACGM